MANTYTQIFIQIVFAVKFRARLVSPVWKNGLERYITGIVQNKGHKMIRLSCMPDHSHIFIGMKPHEALSDLVRDVKRDSTAFINSQNWVRGRFAWQEGFGGFSYSPRDVDRVVKYIMNQEEHHRRVTFKEEYEVFLREFGVEYDPRYTLKEPSE